jgi:hypothetical protein
MIQASQKRFLEAIYKLAIPIARSLLRSGIGFREFSDCAKAAFVETAANEFSARGRPANVSRISAMTGIARKSVKKYRAADLSAENFVTKFSPAGELLHAWFTDPEYLDLDNRPKVLPIEGAHASFNSLVSKSLGDISANVLRKELLRVSAIEEIPSGRLKVLSRSFVPPNVSERLEAGLLAGFRQLAEAINKAICGNKHDSLIVRECFYISDSTTKEFCENSISELLKFEELLDDAVSKYELSSYSQKESVGVGVFYFQSSKQSPV